LRATSKDADNSFLKKEDADIAIDDCDIFQMKEDMYPCFVNNAYGINFFYYGKLNTTVPQ
jgi:hypothetical protein